MNFLADELEGYGAGADHAGDCVGGGHRRLFWPEPCPHGRARSSEGCM
jgi:hypothetical protein